MPGNRLPVHVAIIMDGNGRWARARGYPRFRGHWAGVDRVEEIAHTANNMGIKYVTLFTFSTENWRRPQDEVSMLMKTVCTVLETRIDKLLKVNIRVMFVGKRQGLSKDVLASIDKAVALTEKNTGLILNLAFNYGARVEILDAVRELATAVKTNKLAVSDIDENIFSQFLYTAGMPDPDLLIRTSGEKRLSNFLLWQMAYAEIYFTEKFWPDFGEKEFKKAIADYQQRDRRFGKSAAHTKTTSL
ncbi:MAG: isoprenyl transferase [Candidatus Omnitrophica bacterium]|nr:isoprenyl transferase [Candidatus Omnitrophota bacterium]